MTDLSPFPQVRDELTSLLNKLTLATSAATLRSVFLLFMKKPSLVTSQLLARAVDSTGQLPALTLILRGLVPVLSLRCVNKGDEDLPHTTVCATHSPCDPDNSQPTSPPPSSQLGLNSNSISISTDDLSSPPVPQSVSDSNSNSDLTSSSSNNLNPAVELSNRQSYVSRALYRLLLSPTAQDKWKNLQQLIVVLTRMFSLEISQEELSSSEDEASAQHEHSTFEDIVTEDARKCLKLGPEVILSPEKFISDVMVPILTLKRMKFPKDDTIDHGDYVKIDDSEAHKDALMLTYYRSVLPKVLNVMQNFLTDLDDGQVLKVLSCVENNHKNNHR